MESLKLNNKRGLLAVVMALAMVFAATTFVVGEADETTGSTSRTVDVSLGDVFEDIVADGHVTGDAEDSAAITTIELKADITVDVSSDWNATGLTVNGNGHVITIDFATDASEIKINGSMIFKQVKFENTVYDTGDTEINDKYITEKFYLKGGQFTFEGCEFLEVENNEHVIKTGASKVVFKDVDFNGKTVNIYGGTVVFEGNCKDVDINTNDKDITMVKGDSKTTTTGISVVMFDAIAEQTVVNFYGENGNLDLGGKEWTFRNVNERTQGNGKIINGTLKDTTFGTYDGVKGDYRDSKVEMNGVTLSGTTSVAASNGKSVTLAGSFDLADDAVIEIDEGCGLEEVTVAYGTGDNKKTVVVTLKAAGSGMTLSEGSILINGSFTSDAVINAGNADLILENVVIVPGTVKQIEVEGTITIKGSVTIPEGVSFIKGSSGAKILIKENSSLNIAGAIAETITVENNGTIILTSDEASIPPKIEGTGTVDTSGIASEGTLSGTFDTTTSFKKNQTITATGDITLVKGTVFTFEGMLIIPEGVTVTVEDGAKLIIQSSTGKLVNNGTIVVESRGSAVYIDPDNDWSTPNTWDSGYEGAFVIEYGEVVNDGNIILSYDNDATDASPTGWVMNIASGTVTNNGTITVEGDAQFAVNGNLVNNGTVDMDGEIIFGNAAGVTEDSSGTGYNPAPKILNSGSIVLSGKTNHDFTIYLTSSEATVTFDGLASTHEYGNVVIVSDMMYKEGTKTFTDDEVEGTEAVEASQVTAYMGSQDSIEGLVVGIEVVKDDVNSTASKTKYYRQLVLSGTVTGSTEVTDDKPVVNIETNAETAVNGELSLSKDVALYINGKMDVPGTIAYTTKDDGYNGQMMVKPTGILNVTGSVSGNDREITHTGATINAAFYKVDGVSSEPDMYHYTTLAAAVEAAAEEIDILGKVYVASDVTVPNGATLDNSDSDAIIVIEDGVTVTMASGSKLKNGGTAFSLDADGEIISGVGILVNGTLIIEDLKGTKAPANITSEVKVSGENTVTYTNLSKALSTAQEGDVVKLSGSAHIDVDTTVPAGVTVETGTGNQICVCPDAELTVDGTVYLNGGSLKLDEGTEQSNGTIPDDGEIVLNGSIKSDVAISTDLAIPGAYYNVTTKGKIAYFVEPVSVAAPKIATADALSMELRAYATELEVGNVTFTGTSDAAATVTIDGKVGGNITLDLASLVFYNGETFVGTVTNGVGTIALDGKAGANLKATSSTKDDVKTLSVSGAFEPGAKKKVTVEGDVSFYGFDATPVTVDGNVTVTKKSEIGVLTVNGTVTVSNEVTLKATDAYVLGTVTVSEATESKTAGKLEVTDLYVGLVKKDVYEEPTSAGAATVAGNMEVSNHMFVLAGATIPEDLVDEDTPYQELYVEGKLWMTVYAFGTDLDVEVNQIPVENVQFQGWASEEGKDGKDNFSVKIEDKKVYADIEYRVYVVEVQVSEGVDDVYIDGILMLSTSNTNVYGATVAAGIHTISYTLANGYTGQAKMLVNGTEVSGYTFTTEGEYEGVVYQVILQGIEKAPAEVGGGDAPTVIQPEKDEGMSLTDILLIILVVLIVIMAVIVALRMMRS